ncbi:MAG TPA: hypothetical protein LFV92_04600 [Rickettsia endosymbiont of Ceroptres masudai]|nr:hypothetical protein [Rickettsia endosymbiont of Ceroptres masudai]
MYRKEYPNRHYHCEEALLRGSVKPLVRLLTRSIKTITNTNILVFLTGSRGQATG